VIRPNIFRIVYVIRYVFFSEIPIVQIMATEEENNEYRDEDSDTPAAGGKLAIDLNTYFTLAEIS
jgi:hypothetical protein